VLIVFASRKHGGDGFTYIAVNRRVNGDVIVRRERDGARATSRTTGRVVRTTRFGMCDFMVPAMVRRNY